MIKDLRHYKKIIASLPHGLALKNSLESTRIELIKTIRQSKRKNSNPDYYEPKIKNMFNILRKNL